MSQSSCASFVFFFFFLGYLKGSINFFPQVPLETVAENVTGNLGSSKIVNTSKRHYLQRVASREKESTYTSLSTLKPRGPLEMCFDIFISSRRKDHAGKWFLKNRSKIERHLPLSFYRRQKNAV